MAEKNKREYQIGYEDGKQDKTECRPDLQWRAIPTERYTNNHSYWDGYGDGWFGSKNKYQKESGGE